MKGALSYSETNNEALLVIIDGKPYTWQEVGRLFQAFEGFQVKIEMKDLGDEADEWNYMYLLYCRLPNCSWKLHIKRLLHIGKLSE